MAIAINKNTIREADLTNGLTGNNNNNNKIYIILLCNRELQTK
jgi:hypothetical protein